MMARPHHYHHRYHQHQHHRGHGWNPYQSRGTGIRTECQLLPAVDPLPVSAALATGGSTAGRGCSIDTAPTTTTTTTTTRSANAYFAVTNTVSTAYWAAAKRQSCDEEACSAELKMERPIIQAMHVYQEGRRRTSALPFRRTESVNFTTVKAEDDRDAFAVCFQLQRLVGFGRRLDADEGDKGGHGCEFFKTNDNFMTLLHGVMNRDEYVRRLLGRHQANYYSNSLFPSIRRAFVDPSSSASSSRRGRGEEGGGGRGGGKRGRARHRNGRVRISAKVQLYKDSLAVNLQKYDAHRLAACGPVVLSDLLREARLDVDLNRLCVDAEHRRDRNLDDSEKREILFWYYSARWLSATEEPPSSSPSPVERPAATPSRAPGSPSFRRPFRFCQAMQHFVAQRLVERSSDYRRYAYAFRRRKRTNCEIYDVCGDPRDAVYRCPHSRPFVAFVVRLLRSQGHVVAARTVARASKKATTTMTTGTATGAWSSSSSSLLPPPPPASTEELVDDDGGGGGGDATRARIWWVTHIEQKSCSLF